MKFNIKLLKEWINSDINVEILLEKITLYGFECFIENDKIVILVPNNRNDCLSFFSIFQNILNFDKKKYINQSDFNTDIDIIINEKKFCPFYSYIIIKNINIQMETPFFIKEMLIDNNIKLNNLILDVINYVIILTGQPLHAYNLSYLDKNINIKKFNNKKKFISINNESIDVEKNIHLTLSNNKIISISGIIGSFDSKINENTVDILIESAYFNSNLIKKNLKKINIETFSSNLFKNNINIKFTTFALNYATFLLNSISKSISSNIYIKKFDNYFNKKQKIVIKKEFLDKKFGFSINFCIIISILNDLDYFFKVYFNTIKIYIPFYRRDILIKENILSEIVKIYEYKNIKLKYFNNKLNCNIKKNDSIIKIKKISEFLINQGYNEVINYSFVDSIIEKQCFPNKELIFLKNPISIKLDVMRSSLLQCLLKSANFNLNRNIDDLFLFEIGNIFFKNKNLISKKSIAGICTNNYFYNKPNGYLNKDFFIVKNIINVILKIIFEKTTNLEFNNKKSIYLEDNLSLNILNKNKIIGCFGLLKNSILNLFSIKQKLYFFEIFIDKIEKIEIKNLNKISKFQIVKRDISIILNNDNTNYLSIINFIKDFKIIILNKIYLVNIYNINKFKKSFTIRLLFKSFKKTFLDSEINFVISFLLEKIKYNFNAVIKK